MSQREVRGSRFHSNRVILSHIRRRPSAIVSHVKRTTIYVEIRAKLSNGRLINLMTIERAANGLRDAMSHRLALDLLGQEGLTLAQRLFRMLALGEVAPDALHANGLAVSNHQTRTDFEPDTFALFRDDVDLINS